MKSDRECRSRLPRYSDNFSSCCSIFSIARNGSVYFYAIIKHIFESHSKWLETGVTNLSVSSSPTPPRDFFVTSVPVAWPTALVTESPLAAGMVWVGILEKIICYCACRSHKPSQVVCVCSVCLEK